ncbi:forkhead box protein D3-B-like [Ceratitis capitata]|uniref:forkhead box protein D3-B-like n=1 Tax=Ceratitis capitata TaxID=7213 RepID=UPI0003297F8D|nr:forkhead box protein D3-B-like [Ceratitis capitata]
MAPTTEFSSNTFAPEEASAQQQSTAQPTAVEQQENSSPMEESVQRPKYTYPQLITMAIDQSAQKKLPLSAILEWISESFPYYQRDQTSWQNQVRHALSTNRKFAKVKRPTEDPGRGNYWTMSSSLNHPELNASPGGSGFNMYPMETIAVHMPMSYPEVSRAAYIQTAYEIQRAQQIHYYQRQYMAAAQWSNLTQ